MSASSPGLGPWPHFHHRHTAATPDLRIASAPARPHSRAYPRRTVPRIVTRHWRRGTAFNAETQQTQKRSTQPAGPRGSMPVARDEELQAVVSSRPVESAPPRRSRPASCRWSASRPITVAHYVPPGCATRGEPLLQPAAFTSRRGSGIVACRTHLQARCAHHARLHGQLDGAGPGSRFGDPLGRDHCR
jgi:hypothetical protein